MAWPTQCQAPDVGIASASVECNRASAIRDRGKSRGTTIVAAAHQPRHALLRRQQLFVTCARCPRQQAGEEEG